jgi:two-component system OmpR family response regulator
VVSARSAQDDHTLSVLVVDDEDYVADMIAAALHLDGYVVHVAYNGRDGLVQAQALRLDMIIVDIMMPYLGGVALIEELRKLGVNRDVPIMLISAGARPQRPLPNMTFMAKPFNIDQLTDLVAAQIGKPERGADEL